MIELSIGGFTRTLFLILGALRKLIPLSANEIIQIKSRKLPGVTELPMQFFVEILNGQNNGARGVSGAYRFGIGLLH
ncbi:MAG: hypothetical protein DRR42_10655 [Gammaproteobacteria bacterium]|nr:MAG: hypothetical protein DRR42_10655 [Gammaproteobacteria bacterium]